MVSDGKALRVARGEQLRSLSSRPSREHTMLWYGLKVRRAVSAGRRLRSNTRMRERVRDHDRTDNIIVLGLLHAFKRR